MRKDFLAGWEPTGNSFDGGGTRMTPTGMTPTGMTATRMGSTELAGVGNRDVVFVIQGLTFLSQKKEPVFFGFFCQIIPQVKKDPSMYIGKMHLPFIGLFDNTTIMVICRVIK